MKNELVPFVKFVDFIADMLGEDSEVVLHDLTDLNNSIVAIRNGHNSGRQVGGPATDLVLRVMKGMKYKDKDFLSNYRGYAKNGNILKSSTFFIKDKKEKIIGMLCVNTDCGKLIEIRDFLSGMLPVTDKAENNPKNNQPEEISEKFNLNAEELTLESINKIVAEAGVSPERMSQQEKIDVVKRLYEMGVFLLKGAVTQTASTLKISEPSVYRYLNQIKRAEEKA